MEWILFMFSCGVRNLSHKVSIFSHGVAVLSRGVVIFSHGVIIFNQSINQFIQDTIKLQKQEINTKLHDIHQLHFILNCHREVSQFTYDQKENIHIHFYRHCKLCPSMSNTNSVTNHLTNKTSYTDGGKCNTKYTIYAAECTKHNLLYIGQSSQKLNYRFNGHRPDVRLKPKACELTQHFS